MTTRQPALEEIECPVCWGTRFLPCPACFGSRVVGKPVVCCECRLVLHGNEDVVHCGDQEVAATCLSCVKKFNPRSEYWND